MRGLLRTGFICLALLTSTIAAADGVEVLDFAGGRDHIITLKVGADGRLQAQTFQDDPAPGAYGLFGTAADGNLLSTFGQTGRLALGNRSSDAFIAADGSFLTLLPQNVQLRDATGVVLFTSPDIYSVPVGTTGFIGAVTFKRQSNSKIVVGGELVVTAQGGDSLEWTLARLAADGTSVDTTFAGGLVRVSFAGTGLNRRGALRTVNVLSNDQLLVTGTVETNSVTHTTVTMIERFTANGGVDGTYGVNGQITRPESFGRSVIDSSDRVYIAELNGTVTRLTSAGAVDGTYAGGAVAAGTVHINNIVLDSTGRIVTFGWINAGGVNRAYIARLDTSGNPDASFNTTGTVLFDFVGPLAPSSSEFPVCTGALQGPDKPVIACDITPPGDANGNPPADIAIARFNTSGTLDATFGVNQVDSDGYPDPFTFAPQTVAFGAANVESEAVTITGINMPVYLTGISTGASFSLGCNGTWQNGSTTLVNGDTFCVRQNAPATAGQTNTLNVRVGGRLSPFLVTASNTPADTVPDAFGFQSRSNVALGAIVVSDTITIQGINGRVLASIANGEYSVGCTGTFTGSNDPNITSGTTICVRHTAAATAATQTTTTLTVGGTFGTFTSTTVPSDTTPDAFTFTAQNNVALGSVATSNTVTIAGINSGAAISVAGGEYSVGCNGTFTSTAGTIQSGQTVCVRHTASAAFSTQTTTTLTVGGVAGAFSSTTLASDTTPDVFAFTNQSNVATSSTVVSNSVTIGGINTGAAISVAGGEYSIGCNGTFTATAGTIQSGQTVCVRHTASAQGGTTINTTLTIGGVAATFSSTTASGGSGGGGGGGGGGGALDTQLLAMLLALTVARLWWERNRRRRGAVQDS